MKKREAFALAAAGVFMLNMMPAVQAGSDIFEITGGTVTGIPVTVQRLDSEIADGTWQISDDGENFIDADVNQYTDTSDSYYIKPADEGKYLRYAQGEEKSDMIGPLPVSAGPVGITAAGDAELRENTDSDYCFSLAGSDKTYILLDYSDQDGAFIITKDYYGKKKWANANSLDNIKFDPDDENNIAYKLNNELIENGWNDDFNINKKYIIEDPLKDFITEHEWFTEAAYKTTNAPADYIITAKVALLSRQEWIKYKSIIGYSDQAADNNWYLRTARGDNSTNAKKPLGIITQSGSNAGRAMQLVMTDGSGIRPCFYLNRDFFAVNKLDCDSIGGSVKKFIVDTFTKDELISCGYTLGDLSKLGYDVGDIPTVSDVEVVYDGIPGEPMYARYTLSDDADSEMTQVNWYKSSSVNGTYTQVSKNPFSDKGDKYYVKPGDKNQYFKCEVIPKNSDGVEGLAVMSDNSTGAAAANVGPCSVTGKLAVSNAKTPSEYTFAIDGEAKEYILLDAEKRSTDGIFMFTKNYYGRVRYADINDADHVRFDPEDTSNFAYKLNNTFLSKGWQDVKGVSFSFSQTMAKQLVEHKWFTESGYPSSAAAGDYNVVCKLAPLSLAEWKKYGDRIGYSDDCPDNFWGLRTARGDQDSQKSNMLVVCTQHSNASAGTVGSQILNYGYDTRFGFYVSGDFFKNVKIDVSSIGSEVLKVLYESCTKEELIDLGYTDEEIEYLGYNSLPYADNLAFSGTVAAGEEISLSYDYHGDIEEADQGIYEWYIADTVDGTYEIIGTDAKVKLDDDCGGKYLKVVFRPVAQTGIQGNAVELKYISAIRELQDVSASIENVNVLDNKVSFTGRTVNRNGDHTLIFIVSAYDDEDGLIYLKSFSKNAAAGDEQFTADVPQGTNTVRIYCVTNDAVLRPMAVYKQIIR